ncbi:MAG: hypothetical protein Q9165_001195 [Trypethelium subeluteriae]
MPDKPLTIATYAAGASLAAITLVYVFGPTFFLDDESASTSSNSRKKGVVGLSNPANDCFINSVLQASAGLGHLRTYLIRELHRRDLDGAEIYSIDAGKLKREPTLWKINGLQQGLVTKALKDVLDSLNERPLYKKTISARGFILELEKAFRTRISRQQQDAQEFLQVVMERVCEEYHAGKTARRKARTAHLPEIQAEDVAEAFKDVERASHQRGTDEGLASLENSQHTEKPSDAHGEDAEDGFPLEGKIESQVECLTCWFRPKPSISSFVTLTLNVPYETSTTLNKCFDGMLKIEHIDDYTCDKCRLQHAIEVKQRELGLARSNDAEKAQLKYELSKIEDAIADDPEKPPKDVRLPENPPKRRITRHMRFVHYPEILAIHLSRSVFDPGSISTKNMAKVSFPETLSLGGILDQKRYKLVAMVSHIGVHSSGHYESFRRQLVNQPYSTPHSFGTDGVYSVSNTPGVSITHSPRPSADVNGPRLGPDSAPTQSLSEKMRLKRKAKSVENRWWRISDDKIKDSKTSEVLAQQKGVYLLFYTLIRPRDDLEQ